MEETTQHNITQQTNETKTPFQFAFRWGSIIGFITLLYYLIGFYTKFERFVYFADIYFLIEIALIGVMITKYKRENNVLTLKFSKMIKICFYASIIIAAFYALYFALKIIKLDPLFFQTYMSEVFKLMQESFQVDYSANMTPQTYSVFKASFVFATYLSFVFNTMFYSLLLCAFISFNQKLYIRK